MVAERQKFCYKVTHILRRDEPIPEYKKKSKNQATVFETNNALKAMKSLFVGSIKKNFFKVDSYFMRRQQIYFIGTNGEMKKLNINTI